MNREIRFRAWDNDFKVMHHFLEKSHLLPVSQPLHTYLNNERFEVMQYTGIKDRNGKEIFEGDVVKDSEQTYIVRFGEQIEVDIEFIGFYFEHIYDKTFNGAFSSFDSNVLEIIGNIYDNPELTK